jgi:predicted nucleotidyltransferase
LGKPLGRLLVEHRDAVLAAAARRHTSNGRVFGSVVRGDDTPTSEIDLLVDVDREASVLDLLGPATELKELLGVQVDVGRAAALRSGIRDVVLAEALAL